MMTLQWVDWLVLGVLGGGFGFITAATAHNWRNFGKPPQSERALIVGGIALMLQFLTMVILALAIALYWKFLAG